MGEPAKPEACPDAIGKGCWIGDGQKPIYRGKIMGIVKHPMLPLQIYQIISATGVEYIDPAFVIVNE